MTANPYEPPRESEYPDKPPQSVGRSDRAVVILGSVFAGINLLTFLSLGVREILVYFDLVPSFALYLGGFVVGMVLIPVLARAPGKSSSDSVWSCCLAGLLIALELPWLFNVFVGAFCRGPNWNFFWPWEEHDPYRVVAINNLDLSQYVWWYWLNTDPKFWWLRESPGFTVLALWLVVVPLVATRILRFRFPAIAPSSCRLLAACFLVQFMALLPLKMLLRATFNLKYFIAIHEFTVNV